RHRRFRRGLQRDLGTRREDDQGGDGQAGPGQEEREGAGLSRENRGIFPLRVLRPESRYEDHPVPSRGRSHELGRGLLQDPVTPWGHSERSEESRPFALLRTTVGSLSTRPSVYKW